MTDEHEGTNGVLTMTKRMTAILSLVIMVVSAGYGLYAWGSDYHNQFAKQNEVEIQFLQTKLTILKQEAARYEDLLFELNFKINNDEATPLDRAKREKVEDRLEDLRDQIHTITAAMRR